MTRAIQDPGCVRCYGDGCPTCRGLMPPRCAACGEPWPRAGEVCSPRCAASLAEMMATFAGPDPVAQAASDEAEAMRWRFGDADREF